MHPWIFVAFGREIRYYGLGYAVTLLVGANIAAFLLRKRGHNGDRLWDGLIVFMPLAFIGARLTYVLTNLNDYIGQGWEWIRIDHGGLSFHGGIIGALIGMALFYRKGNPTMLQVMDASAIPVALGVALVRIGNFMNGDITGYRWDGPWAMNFPYDELHVNVYHGPGDYTLDGSIILRHPTEIYGFLVGVILIFLMIYFWRTSKFDGYASHMFILWYSVVRSLIEEPFRDVPHYLIDFKIESIGLGGITMTQWVSALLVIYCIIAMRFLKAKSMREKTAAEVIAEAKAQAHKKSEASAKRRRK